MRGRVIMRDSIEIYASIRKWENLRIELIRQMRNRQLTLATDEDKSDIEIRLRDEMKEIEYSFFKDSTDVEFIVTSTFPELKKGAWYKNFYIEENKIEFEGYEYKLFKDKYHPKYFMKSYSCVEDAVKDIMKSTNSISSIESVIASFYF